MSPASAARHGSRVSQARTNASSATRDSPMAGTSSMTFMAGRTAGESAHIQRSGASSPGASRRSRPTSPKANASAKGSSASFAPTTLSPTTLRASPSQ